MTWLRIHDGFTQNSKIAQLTDGQFRVWMRLLCYCGSSRDPSVDRVALREVSGLTSHRIRVYKTLGLLDEIGDELEVHDWPKYLPKEEQNAARQAKWRARKRNAERNASSNGEVTPSRAGTRGVPSRPQDQNPSVQPVARPPAVWDGEEPDGLNGLSENGLPDLTTILKDIP